MSKPVELIVTNELHRIAEAVEQKPRLFAQASEAERGVFFEQLSRSLLCDVAHNAHAEVVVKALVAIGLGGGIVGLEQRFAAVRESRSEERRTLGVGEPAPAESAQAAPTREEIVAKVSESLAKAFGPGISITTVPVKVGGED